MARNVIVQVQLGVAGPAGPTGPQGPAGEAASDVSELTTEGLPQHSMLRVEDGALVARNPAEVRDDLDIPAIEGAGDPVTATAATATVTPPTGSNNAALYTAVTPGAAGNDISVGYEVTTALEMENRVSATVAVTGTDIIVTAADRANFTVAANYGTGVETVTLPFTSASSGNYTYTSGVYTMVISTTGSSDDAVFSLSKSGSTKFIGTAKFSVAGFFVSVVASNGGTGTPTATISRSTAAQVIAAVNASAPASALVTASASGASTGSVAYTPAVSLTGGGGSVGVTGVYPGQLYRDTVSGAWWKFTGTTWEEESAGGNYAPAIEIKTTNFTAAIGGRYIIEGTVTVTDPAGTTVGQSYEVWIGSGTATLGGVSYGPSRFSIRRRYTGSAWATPAPFLTDALTFADAAKAGTRNSLCGATGAALAAAADITAAKAALGIVRVTRLADDTVSNTTRVPLTGMTFTLAASTWYKLELAYRFTSTGTSGLRYFLQTTGTFATEGAAPGALGPGAQNAAISSTFQNTTTELALRGNTTTAADNQRGFGVAYFKTNASGTGSIAIALNSGTSTGTSHEVVAVLSLF